MTLYCYPDCSRSNVPNWCSREGSGSQILLWLVGQARENIWRWNPRRRRQEKETIRLRGRNISCCNTYCCWKCFFNLLVSRANSHSDILWWCILRKSKTLLVWEGPKEKMTAAHTLRFLLVCHSVQSTLSLRRQFPPKVNRSQFLDPRDTYFQISGAIHLLLCGADEWRSNLEIWKDM